MKRNQAITLYNTIVGVKLNKMSDEMIDAILANTLAVSAIADAQGKAVEELRKRTIETIDRERLTQYDEMQTKMSALEGRNRAAMQAVINDNYKDVQIQISRLNKAINAWLDKPVSIDLVQIDRKKFVKACQDAEQTLASIDIERLAPIFFGYAEPTTTIDTAEIDALLTEE